MNLSSKRRPQPTTRTLLLADAHHRSSRIGSCFFIMLLSLCFTLSLSSLALANGDTSDSFSEEEKLWSAKCNVVQAREAAERGELGRAALHLERARYLRPFDIEIREGLDLLRQQVQRERMMKFNHARLTQGEPDGLWWWRLFHVLPTRIWAGIGLAGIWITFGFWLASRRMKTGVPKDIVWSSAAFNLLVALASFGCWVGAVRTSVHLEPGVVVQASPRFYRAPDELSAAEQSPELYEGAMVLIRSSDAQWLEIELAGQQRVWVAAHTVEPVAIAQHTDSAR